MDEEYTSYRYGCGPNDGGIKRGDRAETGDDEAQATENSSSVPGDNSEDLEDLQILEGDDPTLGLGHGEEG